MPSQFYDFEADWVAETDKAMCLEIDGNEVWFPKSVLESNDDGSYTIPLEWAEEKGLT